MLDLGWSEILIVGTVAIVVVGPNEMPRVVRGIMGAVRKARNMASDFQSSMEDIANDADLLEIKKTVMDSETKIDSIIKEQMSEVEKIDAEVYSSLDALAGAKPVKKIPSKKVPSKKASFKSPPPKKVSSKKASVSKDKTSKIKKNISVKTTKGKK